MEKRKSPAPTEDVTPKRPARSDYINVYMKLLKTFTDFLANAGDVKNTLE